VRLYSRIIGWGSPLIILHGLFGMSDNWITIGNILAAQGFCVHLLDLRNHGKSPHASSHRYPDMCDDLLSYFERQDFDKASILGHSMGGKLGMVFGLLEPEKIDRLVIADIAPSDYRSAENNYHRTIIDTLKQIDLEGFTNRGPIRKELEVRLGDQPLAQFLAKSIGRDKASGRFTWKFNLPILDKFLQHIYIGLEELSIYAPCPVKTLFVTGSRSSYYLETHEPDRHFFFPDSDHVVIDNAGHWLHSDQPETFTDIIVQFLS